MRAPSLVPFVRLLQAESRRFEGLVRAALGDLAATVAPAARTDAVRPKVAEALRRLLPHEEAERRLAAEATRNIVRRKLDEVSTGVGHVQAAVRETAVRVATTNLREFRRVFDLNREGSVVNIAIRGVQPGIAPMIDRFQEQNVSLITRMHEQTLSQVRTVLDEHWTAGERVEQLRDALAERFEVSESRAALIARDQVLKLNGQITKQRQTSAGVRQYIWTTAGDERVRGSPEAPKSKRDHYHLDGTVQSWDAPPVVAEDGTTAHPGEDYQCRCIAYPVLDSAGGGEDDSEDAPAAPAEAPPVPEVPFEALFQNGTYRPDLVQIGRIADAGGLEGSQYLRDPGSYRPENLPSIREGAAAGALPPVKVDIEADGSVQLVDGRHRLAVALERGDPTILAHVRQRNAAGDVVATRLEYVPTRVLR